MKTIRKSDIQKFRRTIREHYRKNGRKLPFRETSDPYAITVSEIMLQQTQVERVIEKYLQWMKFFPDWKTLAKTSNQNVLKAWSGLGYNRRALYLKQMASQIVNDYNNRLPDDIHTLKKFPGIGTYTAHAIAIFAFGKKMAAVDTNVRKVLIYFFSLQPEIPRSVIQQIAQQVLPPTKVREWHYALMDYAKKIPRGSLPTIGGAGRQSKFEGSIRQIRGEIIRQLTVYDSISYPAIAKKLNRSLEDINKAANALSKDGLIEIRNKRIYLIK